MAYVIEFRTEFFDVAAEPENPISPIYGHSVLVWLGAKLKKEGVSTPEPGSEDWGWYFDLSAFGNSYLVGASAESDDEGTPGGPMVWVVQIDKHRRLSEKLMGKNKLGPEDPLCHLIEKIIRSESSIQIDSASHGT